MTGGGPAFPPDVASALQRPSGRVSVRYTVSPRLDGPPGIDTIVMCTPYEEVLAVLAVDTKGNLRFVRTGSAAEGARVALADVTELLGAGRHWDIELRWDADHLEVSVADQAEPQRRFSGRWPR